jgi:hypothetical protein
MFLKKIRKFIAVLLVNTANFIYPEFQLRHTIEYGEATMEADNLALIKGTTVSAVEIHMIN